MAKKLVEKVTQRTTKEVLVGNGQLEDVTAELRGGLRLQIMREHDAKVPGQVPGLNQLVEEKLKEVLSLPNDTWRTIKNQYMSSHPKASDEEATRYADGFLGIE